jgi:hypothetical protein
MVVWPCRIEADLPPVVLRKHGPLVPGRWTSTASDQQSSIDDYFLVDTGASGFCIDQSIADSLGLVPTGTDRVHGVHGHSDSKKYFANLVLPVSIQGQTHVRFAIPVECTGVPGLLAQYGNSQYRVVGIIGRNLLQFCKLTVDGTSGNVILEINESVTRPAREA